VIFLVGFWYNGGGMIPEKSGHYWIKIKNGNYYSGWIVGEYSDGYWESIGNEVGWKDDEVVKIGSEIIMPEDT